MSVTEFHPLLPFLPSHAKLLMLGSFPPPKHRWKMEFYYPNIQNDMWRIFGLVFWGNKEYFLTADKKGFNQDLIQRFVEEKGIAISDTAYKVIREKENASDRFLQVVEPIALERVLDSIPECNAIVVTGEKAAEVLQSILFPETKIPSPGNFIQVDCGNRSLTVWRMPSSSRAYPKSLEKKAEDYKKMFQSLGLL